MKTRRILHTLLLVALLGLSLGAASIASAASGSASPAQATPGARVHFNATGFAAGERVDFWISSPDGRTVPRYPSVVADAGGAVAWSWDVPAGVANGNWTAGARGVTSATVLGIPFSVTGSNAAPSTITVTPTSAAPGATFTFQAAGFTPSRPVRVWLVDPSGASRDLVPGEEPGLIADASGALTWSWTAPADAVGGAWQMIARDSTTGAERAASFTITAPERAQPGRSVTPAAGAPGTTFTVSLGGFTPGERVGSWLVTPTGQSVDATPYLVADGSGVVTWKWTSPASAQAGSWQAVSRGRESNREVAVGFTVTGGNGAPVANNPASGSVSPSSGTAGTTFSFTINGFERTERVAYWPTQPDGTVEQTRRTPIRVDGAGYAVLTWEAPARAQSGSWTMTFEGISSGRVLTIGFSVAAEQASASVSPTSGAPGATFTFTADGFNVIERVDTWLERPDGSVIGGPSGVRANRDGLATWTWTAPADAPRGGWTLVARGQDSDVTYRIPFAIE